jgi:hypothetical protein
MIADPQLMEKIVDLVQQLSPEYRLRLIQHITETLIPSSVSPETNPLQFGKYKGNRMSTLEDFRLAEWRPTDRELNGG